MVTVSQAIRREVAAMGDGIERALARASELEVLVHNEVASLERSYTDNELRVRGTANLLRAAIDAGVKRLVAESFVGVYGRAHFDRPRSEDEPLPPPTAGGFRRASPAMPSPIQNAPASSWRRASGSVR